MIIDDIIQVIKKEKKFFVVSHANPEGDALGASLAIAKLIRLFKKEVMVINEDAVSQEYKFLPGSSKITSIKKNYNFDVVIVVDCSDIDRVGKIKENIKDRFIINIDHHVGNSNFGDINWVNPGYAATCEMIYDIFEYAKIKIDRATALNLYTGIMTDSGSFRYPNTTSRTHEIIAHLLKWRLPVNKIYQIIYESFPYSDVKLFPYILMTLKRSSDGKIAWVSIKRDILQRKRTSFDLTETVLNFVRSIKGVEVSIVFREKSSPGLIRVNFRSRGRIDVNKIASSFSGGGHKTASGATIQGALSDVERLVLEKIQKSYYKKNK
ncbi:MAG: bifunctional oligoribonuclease/PAP phosphatase NrnA [Candidatus Omnitrophota bacterium]